MQRRELLLGGLSGLAAISTAGCTDALSEDNPYEGLELTMEADGEIYYDSKVVFPQQTNDHERYYDPGEYSYDWTINGYDTLPTHISVYAEPVSAESISLTIRGTKNIDDENAWEVLDEATLDGEDSVEVKWEL